MRPLCSVCKGRPGTNPQSQPPQQHYEQKAQNYLIAFFLARNLIIFIENLMIFIFLFLFPAYLPTLFHHPGRPSNNKSNWNGLNTFSKISKILTTQSTWRHSLLPPSLPPSLPPLRPSHSSSQLPAFPLLLPSPLTELKIRISD